MLSSESYGTVLMGFITRWLLLLICLWVSVLIPEFYYFVVFEPSLLRIQMSELSYDENNVRASGAL